MCKSCRAANPFSKYAVEVSEKKLAEADSKLNQIAELLYPSEKSSSYSNCDVEMHDSQQEPRHSLKTSRRQEVVEKEDAQTVWQCPSCGMNNPLSSNTSCLNNKECKFDLEAGEAEPIFCEMTQTQLEVANN